MGAMKTLVIGLGNPILCDDGIGIRVVQELAARINLPEVDFYETSTSGLGLVDVLTGYQRAIIVDALVSGKGAPGEVRRLSLEDINATLHSTSLHDISIGEALQLGRRLGAQMPEEIVIYGIEVQNIDTFSENCTPEVEKAIPECAARIIEEMQLFKPTD